MAWWRCSYPVAHGDVCLASGRKPTRDEAQAEYGRHHEREHVARPMLARVPLKYGSCIIKLPPPLAPGLRSD